MIDLMDKITTRIEEIKKVDQYIVNNIGDEMVYENYIIFSELLNPDHAHDYRRNGNLRFIYNDMWGNTYGVRLKYSIIEFPHFELIEWWVDKDGKRRYDTERVTGSSVKGWERCCSTVMKIFRDELLPYFIKQQLSNILIVRARDGKQYQVPKRLLQKTISSEWKFEESFPTHITIIKPGN